MAIGIIQGRFQFQRGTHKEWTDSDLILLDGELAIESDTSKIKIGNGRSLYKDLPYIEIGRIGVKDLTEEDLKKITGEKGDKGDPFTYEDLTAEQKLELRGEPGKDGYTPKKGVDYFDGKPGRKGDKGDPLRFEDLTNAQKEELKGDPGKDGVVTFEALTPEQKASLKGDKGEPGKDGIDGKDGNSPKVVSSTTNDENNTVVKFDNGSSFVVDVSNKVDKIEGKTLSDNNFTNAEKQKLAKLSGSPANVVSKKITNESELDNITEPWCVYEGPSYNESTPKVWFVYTMISKYNSNYRYQVKYTTEASDATIKVRIKTGTYWSTWSDMGRNY